METLSVKLEMRFKDAKARSFNLSLEEPKEELEPEEVKAAMDEILELGIFHNKDIDLVVSDSARIISRRVDQVF